MLKKGLL